MSSPAADSRTFLDVAAAIGERLCREARDEDTPTWDAGAHDESGPCLRGPAGVARFLLQLYRRTAQTACLEAARGALRRALRQEDEREQAAGGYYDGTAGLVATLVEADAVDEETDWIGPARRLGEKIARGLLRPGELDLTTGEAGSVLGLLCLHQATGEGASLDAARKLGDELVAKARREPDGVSWDVMHPRVFRNLLGLPHGAGGIGLALLELYRRSGEPHHLVTAVEALVYEDSFPGADEGRWVDLRQKNLARYLEEGRQKDLVRDLLADAFDAGRPSGEETPGVVLVRARFLEVLGDGERTAGLGRAAERTLAEAERVAGPSFHADVLLCLGRQLGEGRYLDAALSLGRRGADGARSAGDAAVGLFYLRCAAPDVPGLLPVPPGPASRGADDDTGAVLAAGLRSGRLAHFPRLRKALSSPPIPPKGAVAAAGDDLAWLDVRGSDELVPALKRHLEALPEPRDGAAAGLSELLELEATAFEMLRAHEDFSRDYLASLQRRRPELLEKADTLVKLAEGSRLVSTEHDWEPLLEAGATLHDVVRRKTTYLLYKSDHRIRVRRPEALAAALCRLLAEPVSVATASDAMVERLQADGLLDDADDEDVARVRERLRRLLQQAFRDGMVDVVEPYDLKPADVTSDLCIRCGQCCRIQIHVPGEETHAEFVNEMLEEPLRATYPEARVTLAGAPGPPYVCIDLGYCRHLDQGTSEDGGPCLTCDVYERRPVTCREFNCVVWWRRQRLHAVGETASDRAVAKVAKLLGRRRVAPGPTGETPDEPKDL